MNLLWHQLKKDLLRTRLLIGLWLAFSLLRFALAAVSVKPDDMAWHTAITLLSPLSILVTSLLVMILMPMLIQQEPLVGTTAFWLTRPLSRRLLLTEKSLFLLGLILVPLFIQSAVFLAAGVTWRDTVAAMPEFVLSQASWFLTIAMIAVLTPGFGRFIIGCAIYFGVSLLGLYVFSILGIFSGRLFNVLPSLTASRGLVSSLLLIGFGVAAVISQYFWRRYGVTLALAIFALVTSTIAGQFWPWNFLKPAPLLAHDPVFSPAAIRLVLTGHTTANDQATLRGGEPDKQIAGPVATPGLDPGYVLRVEKCDADLRTAGAERIPLAAGNNVVFSFSQPGGEEMEAALGGVPIINAQSSGTSFWNFFTVSSATFHRYGSVPVKLSAQFHLLASKYVIATELPVQKGAHIENGSRRERITGVLYQDGGVTLQIETQDVRLVYALRADQDTTYNTANGQAVYVLVNRKTHEAVREKQNDNFDGGISFSSGEGLIHQPRRASFGPENNQQFNSLLPALDDAWLRDAVLVRLELQPVAEFTKTLDLPNFRLDGQYPVEGAQREAPEADLHALENMALPVHATRQQVRDYIASILRIFYAADGQVDDHAMVDAFQQVGAENVDLLIAAAHDSHLYYLNRAIDRLAQPDQKEMVLADLPTNTDLVQTVVDHGWQADAKDLLMAGLAANSSDHPTNHLLYSYINSPWVAAVASLKDPATYPALEAYFIHHPDAGSLRVLRGLPGFDAAGALDQAWKSSQTGHEPWKITSLLSFAAEVGEPDVPQALTRFLGKNNERFVRQSAREVARKYTTAVGQTDDELAAWFKANGANLVFDPAQKKYVISAAPPPPPIPTPASVPATSTNSAPVTNAPPAH